MIHLDLCGHEIHAHSQGGIETCYIIPGYDVLLDIGRCPPKAERQPTLLLSHAHIDHAAGLPYYVSLRSMVGAAAPRVYCPRASQAELQNILEAWSRLQADANECTLEGIKGGDEISLTKNAFARAFDVPHRIASVGYTIYSRKKKLLPELEHLSQAEIGAKAKAGEVVASEVTEPEITYCGDTRIEVLDREPSVLKAKVLLLECTFVDEDVPPEKARKGGHIHLNHLAEHAERFENEAIVLTHFSRRYSRSRIEARMKAKLPKSFTDRLHLLVHD